MRLTRELSHNKLSLISAAAGLRNTALLPGWTEHCKQSLGRLWTVERDRDRSQSMSYEIIVAGTETAGSIGDGVLAALQSLQPTGLPQTVVMLDDCVAAW